MTDEIGVRDVLRLLLEADFYPRQSNTDWHVAAELKAEVLTRAKRAIGSPDDPPEFRAWLDALRIPTNTNPGQVMYWSLSPIRSAPRRPVFPSPI